MDILESFFDFINLFRIGFIIFFLIVGLLAACNNKVLIFAIAAAIIIFFLAIIFYPFIQNIQEPEVWFIDICVPNLLAFILGFTLGKRFK